MRGISMNKKENENIEKRLIELIDRVDLLEELMQKKTRNTELNFEVHLADHCNLNCRGCDHFSPLAKEKFLSIETYQRDLDRLKQLFGERVGRIHLMGGEPLLNEQVIHYMKQTRNVFKYAQIELVTNGILLTEQTDEFWKTCHDYNIVIRPTKYPIKLDYAEVLKKSEKYNVTFRFYNDGEEIKQLYHMKLDISGKQKAPRSFTYCKMSNQCAFLKEGKLYTCPVIPNICHFNEFFGQNLIVSPNDYVDIYSDISAEQILTFLSQPVPFCKYCNTRQMGYGNPWGCSGKNMEEWT